MIWFWTVFVSVILLWYLIVTIIVGYRGAKDIRKILKLLKEDSETNGA
jgi:hypothetical protein